MGKLDKQKPIVTHFDYAGLNPAQRLIVQQYTGEIRERLQRTAQDIWEIGQRLADVRAQLKHGQFDAWLKAEFGWSRRTAYNFINVYETFSERANLAQINIATSALYLLAAPSTPQDVREQYLQQAKDGKKVTHKDLRDAIEQEKVKSTPVGVITPAAPKPEIVAVLPWVPRMEVSAVAATPAAIVPSERDLPMANASVSAGWHSLESHHFVFYGDTASPEFFGLIPDAALAVAATSQDWDHEWLVDVAQTVIVLPESSLERQTLDQLILMFSKQDEIVIFPWLPREDMIAIAHQLNRKVFAGDSSSDRCHRAIVASGLKMTSVDGEED